MVLNLFSSNDKVNPGNKNEVSAVTKETEIEVNRKILRDKGTGNDLNPFLCYLKEYIDVMNFNKDV